MLLGTWVGAAVLLDWLDPYPKHDRAATEASAALGPSTRILAVGASHVLHGINPAVLGPGAMNMGVNAADYRTLLLILRHRLADMPNLRLVLLEADNLCLCNVGLDRRDFTDLYAWGLSRTDLPLSWWSRFRQAIVEYPLVAPFYFSKRLTPADWVLARRIDWVYGGPGFQTYTGQVSAANNGLDRIRAHEQTISTVAATNNLAALAELLHLFRQQDIKVILLTLPHHEGYASNASVRWNSMFSNLLDLARAELGEEMTWWNMDGHPEFTDEDFNDGHHLNGRGAAKLSELLRQKIADLDTKNDREGI